MMNDEQFMKRCLDLAVLNAGKVSPNPMVGAVIVHEGMVIGEGFTSDYGGPHAEVNAVQDAIRRLGESEARRLFTESTIYVSLEPCAHQGKTPPCADLLVEMRFLRVVIGCLDPYSKVNGLGLQKLEDAGIDCAVGILEKECQFINRRFFTRIRENRPYIILKWAETEDGFFAPLGEEQRWISNKLSKQLVHKWRSEEDAILVGTRTALVDNPSLTNRLWVGKSPKRVLIDRDLQVKEDAAIFSDDVETIVFNAHKADWSSSRKYIALENFDLYLPQNIAYQLYLMDVQSILVEGGAQVLNSFIEVGLWDEARVFVAPQRWGTGIPAPLLGQRFNTEQKVGGDTLKTFFR